MRIEHQKRKAVVPRKTDARVDAAARTHDEIARSGSIGAIADKNCRIALRHEDPFRLGVPMRQKPHIAVILLPHFEVAVIAALFVIDLHRAPHIAKNCP